MPFWIWRSKQYVKKEEYGCRPDPAADCHCAGHAQQSWLPANVWVKGVACDQPLLYVAQWRLDGQSRVGWGAWLEARPCSQPLLHMADSHEQGGLFTHCGLGTGPDVRPCSQSLQHTAEGSAQCGAPQTFGMKKKPNWKKMVKVKLWLPFICVP